MKCFLPPSSMNPKNIPYPVPHGPWRVHHGPWYLPRFFVLVGEVEIDTSLACRPCRREQQLLRASCLAPSRGYLLIPNKYKGSVSEKKTWPFFCKRMMSNNCSTLPETKRVSQPLNGLGGQGLRFWSSVAFLKTGFCERCKDCFNRSLAARKRGGLQGVENHDFSMEIPSRLPKMMEKLPRLITTPFTRRFVWNPTTGPQTTNLPLAEWWQLTKKRKTLKSTYTQ